LEIQGIVLQIKQQFYGGLKLKEILACTGLKEFVSPRKHLIYEYHFLKRKSQNEQEVIGRHQLISVQSDWSQKSIVCINSGAKIFNSLIPLREEFVRESGTWSHQSSRKIFTAAATLHSFKGVHIAIRALKVLVENGVNASLNIASPYPKGIRQSGYLRYILQMIRKYNLESNVKWLGPLDAASLVSELQSADVVLIPSFVESYSLILYESLCIGTPIVCSYAGAMPEAGFHNPEIKYFQPGDYFIAAYHLMEILNGGGAINKTKHSFVSSAAAVNRQLSIYKKIINNYS
jgi:glycosyltransferase involved in cell wall biosynthesis